ncbi:MAG: DUF1016 N-terminal domain-containing protein, partial [Bacteroidota bacterium]|nr:DUF1016 N-terminal domain-containing protein [Bacteroidota bacterium]
MAKQIKEKSIEETLWQSCDKLRGSVEPAEYKHVVLGLIFLKFASDKFEERKNSIHHLTSDISKTSIHHLLSDEFKNDENTEIFQLIFTKLSWTHIRQIMRVKNTDARNYYIKESVNNAWSVETLDRNIATQYYERLFLSHAKEPVKQEMEEKTKTKENQKLKELKELLLSKMTKVE